MEYAWQIFSSVISVLTLIVVILKIAPFPFFDRSGATLMVPTEKGHIAVAKALANIIGRPIATLNTAYMRRVLFKDGASVDWLVRPPGLQLMYDIVELKTIVIGFWRSFLISPMQMAFRIESILHREGYRLVQIIQQPDPAFPQGRVVLILSDALMKTVGDVRYGSAILIRYHALWIGGQRPRIGSPF